MNFYAEIEKNKPIKLPFDAKKGYNVLRGSIYLRVKIADFIFAAKLIRTKEDDHYLVIPNNFFEYHQQMKYYIETTLINHLPNFQKIEPLTPFISELCNRKSKRDFIPYPLTKAQLTNILLAAYKAPSAHNRKPQRYLVIENKEILESIKKLNKHAQMITNASAVVVVLGDHLIEDNYEFLLNDCSASIQNILLAAHSLNLGAVWIGISKTFPYYLDLHKLLNLADHLIAVGMVAIGKSLEEKIDDNLLDINTISYLT